MTNRDPKREASARVAAIARRQARADKRAQLGTSRPLPAIARDMGVSYR